MVGTTLEEIEVEGEVVLVLGTVVMAAGAVAKAAQTNEIRHRSATIIIII